MKYYLLALLKRNKANFILLELFWNVKKCDIPNLETYSVSCIFDIHTHELNSQEVGIFLEVTGL